MTAEQTADAIADAWGYVLSTQEHMELLVLCRGGVTLDDFEFARAALLRSWRVNEEWGYLRTVMLCHRAERLVVRAEALAE